MWPAIAAALGAQAGAGEEETDLATYIAARAHVWKAVVRKQQLQGPDDVRAFLGESLYYGPMLFTPTPRPIILSGFALARTGFTQVEDSEKSLVYWIRNLQSRKLMPAA